MDRLPAILRVPHEIHLENSGDRSVEARGLLAQIDLTFIGNLSTFIKILGEIKLLSDVLQSPSLDLAKAVDLIHALQDTLDQYRSEFYFDELWQDAMDIAEQCTVASETVREGCRERALGLRVIL